MISCRFIYLYSDNNASDSLDNEYNVLAVPRVGEKIQFIGEGGPSEFMVKDVEYVIDNVKGTHEIRVLYSES